MIKEQDSDHQRDINYLLKVKTRNGRWEPGSVKRCDLCTGEDISAGKGT